MNVLSLPKAAPAYPKLERLFCFLVSLVSVGADSLAAAVMISGRWLYSEGLLLRACATMTTVCRKRMKND